MSDPALYALVAMAAVFGGIARAPFTSIIFLFELSRNPHALLPLVVCVMVSDGFVRLFSAESIMTGKLIKRGLIVRQDYTVPVLLRGRIEEVMRKNFTVIHADDAVQTVVRDVSPEQAGVIAVIEPAGQPRRHRGGAQPFERLRQQPQGARNHESGLHRRAPGRDRG